MAETPPPSSVYLAMEQAEGDCWQPFIRQTHNPADIQRSLLRKILSRQADTVFGQKHSFACIQSHDDYKQALPIHGYEDLRRYIEEQDRCREPLLTAEQPIQFVQTSGTTGQPKFIPICAHTRTSVATYQRLFTCAQYRGVPDIYAGRILVLSGQSVEGYLSTGTPYGSMSGLLFEELPSPIRHKDVLPSHVRAMTDVKAKYWHIAACALAEPTLSVMAAPNPTTFLKLMNVIRGDYAELLDTLSSRTGQVKGMPRASARRLAELKAYTNYEARVTFADLWPDLKAVVTWTGGNCGVLIPKLKPMLPDTTALIEMGYLSSECLGSLNVDVVNNHCVPTFQDHVFEFAPLSEWESETPDTVLLDEVEIGEKYQLVVTTSAGLYRYAMNDIVEITGRFNRTPTIRFVQKGKGVTNITGEKLYEHHVITAVESVCAHRGLRSDFYIMLADVEGQRYTLYLESPVPDLKMDAVVERAIAELNVEFKAKRESGRLNPLVVRYLCPGTAEAYRNHCLALGQRDSQFKLVKLQYRHDCSFDFSLHLCEGRRP